MNIEDYTIDASTFARLGNAATTAYNSFSNLAEGMSHISGDFMGSGVNVFRNSDGSLMVYDESSRNFYFIPTDDSSSWLDFMIEECKNKCSKWIVDRVRAYYPPELRIKLSPVDFNDDLEPTSDAELEELIGTK